MRIHRLLITAAAALLLLLPASVVVAQEESPAPDPAAALAGTDFASVFPTELGGLPWDEITVKVGQENFEDLDPDLPTDAATKALLDAILEVTDAKIDDVATASAYRFVESDDDSATLYLMTATQVAGADGDVFRELLILSLAETFQIEQPRLVHGQIAEKDVIFLSFGPVTEPAGEPAGFPFYVSGDTVWMVIADEKLMIEAIGALP